MKNYNRLTADQYFRKNASRDRLTRCYKTDGDEAAFLAKVNTEVTRVIGEKTASLTDEITKLKADLDKAPKSEDVQVLKDSLATMEAAVKALKDNGGKLSPFANSIKEQIKKQMTEKAQDILDFKGNKIKGFNIDIDLKAAATMLESTSLNGSSFLPKPEIRPGYIPVVRNQPLIEQFANGGPTSSATIVYVNQFNPQGTAAVTAEGAAVNLVSTELKTENSTAYLEGAYAKVSIQMLDDIDFMASYIEQEIMYKVNIQTDNDLLTGSGVSTLKGITVYAQQYVNGNISTTNANDFDCIRAAMGQMRALNFEPNIVFFNPTDGANMDLVKDLYGRPIAMEYKDANGGMFRIQAVESNQIAVGKFLLADMTKFWVWNLMNFQISYGWENDDFRKNLVSIAGIRRLHSYASLNHANAFVYDSFVNVKTAIAPAP